MSNQGSSSVGAGASAAEPLAVVAGIGLLINVVGLFYFTWLAVAVLGYIAATLFLMLLARSCWESTSNAGPSGGAVMMLSWVAALATGLLVGAWHWVQFVNAAYVTLGLYGLAVAIWLCGRVLSWPLAFLCTSLGAAMLAAVMCLPAPPGSEEAKDNDKPAKVIVRFVDQAGRPVEGVGVWFDLPWSWQDDPPLRKEPDTMSNRDSDKHLPGGVEYWSLHDSYFKTLVMRTRRPQNYSFGFDVPPDYYPGYKKPGYKDAGYEDVRRELPIPKRGETYEVKIELKERARR